MEYSMCRYCEMKNTEISDCAGDILPEINGGLLKNDVICIIKGNILSGKYDSRVRIYFCPMYGEKLKECNFGV